MNALSVLAIAAVVLWALLVVVAQMRTPEQSPLRLGMSGLARGPAGRLMTLAFVVRGASALLLVAAVAAAAPAAARSLPGLALFALWGLGSAPLGGYPTDMPGEPPSGTGRAHAAIALVAYVAAVAGMVLVSLGLRRDPATTGLARWALPIALVAVVAMLAQSAAFGQAARDTADLAPGPDAARARAVPATAHPGGLGAYAGLLQRVFLALVMVWTVLVAAGV